MEMTLSTKELPGQTSETYIWMDLCSYIVWKVSQSKSLMFVRQVNWTMTYRGYCACSLLQAKNKNKKQFLQPECSVMQIGTSACLLPSTLDSKAQVFDKFDGGGIKSYIRTQMGYAHLL